MRAWCSHSTTLVTRHCHESTRQRLLWVLRVAREEHLVAVNTLLATNVPPSHRCGLALRASSPGVGAAGMACARRVRGSVEHQLAQARHEQRKAIRAQKARDEEEF